MYIFCVLLSCQPKSYKTSDQAKIILNLREIKQINTMLDDWHNAASLGDSIRFFSKMTSNSAYLGTDISERWTKEEMIKDLGKYFNGNEAWHFLPYDRNIFTDGKSIFFEEKLRTWMGPCKGFGVVSFRDNAWKIVYYNLNVAVPNVVIKQYVELLPADSILNKKMK